MLLSSGFSHDRSVLFLEHLFHYQNHYCFHSPQPFKFRRQVLIIRPVYLFLLLHIHFGIPWHGYIYQERFVCRCRRLYVWSSEFTYMVRLYVYNPKDNHIVCLCDLFSPVLEWL